MMRQKLLHRIEGCVWSYQSDATSRMMTEVGACHTMKVWFLVCTKTVQTDHDSPEEPCVSMNSVVNLSLEQNKKTSH